MNKSGIDCPRQVERLAKYWDNKYFGSLSEFRKLKASIGYGSTDDVDFLEMFTEPAGSN